MYTTYATTGGLIGDMDREAFGRAAAVLNVDLASRVADVHSCPVVSMRNVCRYEFEVSLRRGNSVVVVTKEREHRIFDTR